MGRRGGKWGLAVYRPGWVIWVICAFEDVLFFFSGLDNGSEFSATMKKLEEDAVISLIVK